MNSDDFDYEVSRATEELCIRYAELAGLGRSEEDFLISVIQELREYLAWKASQQPISDPSRTGEKYNA